MSEQVTPTLNFGRPNFAERSDKLFVTRSTRLPDIRGMEVRWDSPKLNRTGS